MSRAKSILEKRTASVKPRMGNVFNLYQSLSAGGDTTLKKHWKYEEVGILGKGEERGEVQTTKNLKNCSAQNTH